MKTRRLNQSLGAFPKLANTVGKVHIKNALEWYGLL